MPELQPEVGKLDVVFVMALTGVQTTVTRLACVLPSRLYRHALASAGGRELSHHAVRECEPDVLLFRLPGG